MRWYRNEFAGSDDQTRQAASAIRNLSYNAALTYDYANRYILSANFSRMANDNFSPDNRWGNFWGVSGAWVISEEPFMKKQNVVDLLKLRASYGKTGQSDTGVGRYPYQSTYAGATGYGFGYNNTGINGYAESVIGNENSLLEVSKMLNVGLDWDLWNKKLYG